MSIMDGLPTDAKAALAARIEEALATADELRLLDVGVHLDAALVCLTGTGVHPRWQDSE